VRGISERLGLFKAPARSVRARSLLAHAYEFSAGWPKYIDEHKGVPEAKLWLAYVANNNRSRRLWGGGEDRGASSAGGERLSYPLLLV
jgi:hypothetical protein